MERITLPVTIAEISNVRKSAQEVKEQEFRTAGWQMNHKLTDGDVRIIVEAIRRFSGERSK